MLQLPAPYLLERGINRLPHAHFGQRQARHVAGAALVQHLQLLQRIRAAHALGIRGQQLAGLGRPRSALRPSGSGCGALARQSSCRQVLLAWVFACQALPAAMGLAICATEMDSRNSGRVAAAAAATASRQASLPLLISISICRHAPAVIGGQQGAPAQRGCHFGRWRCCW